MIDLFLQYGTVMVDDHFCVVCGKFYR